MTLSPDAVLSCGVMGSLSVDEILKKARERQARANNDIDLDRLSTRAASRAWYGPLLHPACEALWT